MDRYTAHFWQYIELRMYLDPFFKSCQTSSMNKKAGSKNPLKPKSPFKWVIMDNIPVTSPKFYNMDQITIEEVMDKLDMF